MEHIPDDHCRRTGKFQVVFTETRLSPETEVQIDRQTDPEWRTAESLLLAALNSERIGATAANASWQDLTMWLNEDERLDTFIGRTLKVVDAGVWLLSLAVKELGADDEDDALERLRQLALDKTP